MLTKKYNFHLLLHCATILEEELRVQLRPLGISPRQARVLDALYRIGSASQVELAREFGLTSASMSTMTVRLMKANLIERKVDEHELRSNILTLSPHGRSLLKAIHKEWSKIDKLIIKSIGKDEEKQLANLTLELRNQLGGTRPGEGDKE